MINKNKVNFKKFFKDLGSFLLTKYDETKDNISNIISLNEWEIKMTLTYSKNDKNALLINLTASIKPNSYGLDPRTNIEDVPKKFAIILILLVWNGFKE